MGDVEVACNASQVCNLYVMKQKTSHVKTLSLVPELLNMMRYLEAACPLVVFDQAIFVQDIGCCVHQVHPAPLQQGVSHPVIMRNTVQRGVAEHPHIQVGVAEPVHCILQQMLTKSLKRIKNI